jgi:hypothetical protein
MFARLLVMSCFLLVACATSKAPPNSSPQPVGWKAVLIAGDDEQPAFENAVDTMADTLISFGIRADDIAILKGGGRHGRAATRTNIAEAFASLSSGSGGCFVFLTSHGHERRGLFIRAASSYVGPEELDKLLDSACGDRPTVVIVSGCYSGIYVEGGAMPESNRAILSASRSDRASFGCSASRQYTIFDECVLANLDRGRPWREVMESTRSCVARSESEENLRPPSVPRMYVGSDVGHLLAFPG